MKWANIIIARQLIFLEGILSIDNAAVLGAMAVALPEDKLISWPPWLRWLDGPASSKLGLPRDAALIINWIMEC